VDVLHAYHVHDSRHILSGSFPVLKSFEISNDTLKLSTSRLTVCNVYRPAPSMIVYQGCSIFQFLNDFQTHISLAATNSHEFLITAGFNLHLYGNQNSRANQFLSVIDSSNLVQLVTFPTNRDGHTLDLNITTADSSVCQKIYCSPITPFDHFTVFCQLSI
jgi:hypothetical protein